MFFGFKFEFASVVERSVETQFTDTCQTQDKAACFRLCAAIVHYMLFAVFICIYNICSRRPNFDNELFSYIFDAFLYRSLFALLTCPIFNTVCLFCDDFHTYCCRAIEYFSIGLPHPGKVLDFFCCSEKSLIFVYKS